MTIDILTLFPAMFAPVLGASMLKKAQERGAVTVRVTDIRDYSTDAHRKVDDRPYGGGPGMVLTAQPIYAALERVLGLKRIRPSGKRFKKGRRIVLLSPQGRTLTQPLARELAREEHLVLLCGHYEGFDERIRLLATDEVSIGDYVLTGGELPAMVVLDAVIRLLPKALGDANSHAEESFEQNLLEYPHYTRPAVFRGSKVPEILLSGKHEEIAHWRAVQALKRTKERRPDLLAYRNRE